MKLGVVGNGMIVSWLFRDIKEIPEITAEALCVREKSREKGEALAAENGVPALYTDYEKFLQSETFDTVYLGIANHMHFAYAKQALKAGKHVICEKPFTVTGEEALELAELAKEKGLFLWEAFKIPYSPLYRAIREHLGAIGELKMVQCNYSRISSRYDRYAAGEILPAFDPACAGGCLYDINLYNLHFVTLLFGKPQAVRYFPNVGYNGIDTSGTVILSYDSFHAVCIGAKDASSPCHGTIQGTKGYIRVNGPVSSAETVDLVTPEGTRQLAVDPANGNLTDELREFERQLREGDLTANRRMLEHSVMMMGVVDAARRSVTGRTETAVRKYCKLPD